MGLVGPMVYQERGVRLVVPVMCDKKGAGGLFFPACDRRKVYGTGWWSHCVSGSGGRG